MLNILTMRYLCVHNRNIQNCVGKKEQWENDNEMNWKE